MMRCLGLLTLIFCLTPLGCSGASVVGGSGGGPAGHGNAGGRGGSSGLLTSVGAGGSYLQPSDAGTGGCGGSCQGTTVVVPFCGDGIINPVSEACDDGNSVGGDGCTGACDQVEDGWTCPTPGQPCLDAARCGDGKVVGKETCDDGNTLDGDGCTHTCAVEKGFTCPAPGAGCRPICGDKTTAGSEQCDDGNTNDGDGCNSHCQLEPGYVCSAAGACRKTVCGDGVKEGTEQCDDTRPDAQDLPFDGCFHCQLEPDCSAGTCRSACGDGQRFADEECDDGNLFDGDGCSSSCKREVGFVCNDTPASTLPNTKEIPVVVRDFVGLGRETSPSTSNANYHVDFNRHYGSGNGIFAMVKTTLGSNRKPAWRWVPYKTSDITSSSTSEDTPIPAPLTGCKCDESAPVSAWISSSETWGGGDEGASKSIALSRPPCSCSDGSSCTCDNPGHLFKDSAVRGSNRRNLSTPENLGQWYMDVPGTNLTVPYTLTLSLSDPLTGTYSNIESASATAFDPIGSDGWIAAGSETDSGCGAGMMSNASFTTETHFWFEYQGGEQFAFSGDDDTWVFVNNTLVVDLGGLHTTQDGSFNLDASNGSAISISSGTYYDGASYSDTKGNNLPLGLTLGKVYEVAMFQAERNQCGSNFGVTLKNFARPKSICTSTCGDGIVSSNEYCDDGKNTSTYGGCGGGCVPAPYCGDAKTQAANEECDDGLNVSQYGGCAPGCKRGPYCGDGRVQAPWEECDDGANAGGYGKCGPDCHYGARCGDGIIQTRYEECDDGPDNSRGNCMRNCTKKIIL